MTPFEELQAAHERLMEQSKAPADVDAFVTEVQRGIHQMCVAAEQIPAPRERDQLRAILRFWAAYVYDHTGTYPDTTLHPAVTPSKPALESVSQARPPWLAIAALAGIILLLALIQVTAPRRSSAPQTPPFSMQVVATAESPTAPSLEITWKIVTAGPSPFDAKVWAIKLQLGATGGSGDYIYWVNGARLPDSSDNQFTVEGKGCDAEKSVVGVTSGGQATSIELDVQSPLPECAQP
ncbi:hypothetical protein TFLX_03504 [Thermoflexales bacterium]|nr:hypothetical protein TFLX_03504 [Thermoflexales bacterium]